MVSWNNHIDLLVKKLSMVCCIIRNARIYMSASSLKMIYHVFFHLAMSYRFIFWGNSSNSSTIFSMPKKKKSISIMEQYGNRISCRNLSKKVKVSHNRLRWPKGFQVG